MRSKTEMWPHQDRVATHLYEHDAVQAVVPMGGGKTTSAETAIRELIEDGVIRCALVLAPRLVAAEVWPSEVANWQHLKHMIVRVVDGDEKARLFALRDHADIYCVPLHHIPWLVKQLKTLPEDHKLFDCLVIDESSKLKAPRGKWGGKLLGISRRWKIKWWLTGTPRPNGYEDQFKPLAILTGGKLWGTTQFDKWREKHFLKKDYLGYSWEVRPEHEPKLIKKIASVTFTIDDADMPKLPPIQPVFHWVTLPPKVMATYREMEKHLVAKLPKNTVLADNAAIMTGKLAQIAQGFLYDGDTVTTLHTMKADMLVDLVEELNGLPALIAYEFDEDLRIMQELYDGLPFLGNGVSNAQAAAHQAAWNRKDLPLLALHPASAAHGLNLQFGGQQMIVYGMPWSAELYDQLLKRIHRPGQTGTCFIHHILARGTVDEVKYDRVENKISEQEAFRRYLRRV